MLNKLILTYFDRYMTPIIFQINWVFNSAFCSTLIDS